MAVHNKKNKLNTTEENEMEMEKRFLVGHTSLYNLTLLCEVPNGFLESMLRLQNLPHHTQAFAIWSFVLLGLARVKFIW